MYFIPKVTGVLSLSNTSNTFNSGAKIDLYVNNEKVYAVRIDGVRQEDGEYTSAESWISGSGVLTIKGPPARNGYFPRVAPEGN
jgi:hypothetical protein